MGSKFRVLSSCLTLSTTRRTIFRSRTTILALAGAHRSEFRASNMAAARSPGASVPTAGFRTASCLIIGDEVLNGKVEDANGSFFARYCFSLGLDLKRIEVIADDEEEIKEAVLRMSQRYDFVVTSGGIGPTHDDITYASIAKAFNVPLVLHEETFEKMKRLWKSKRNEESFDWETPSQRLTAKLRMVTLPTGTGCEQYFPSEELWVPIAIVNHNVHILPGIPLLFQQMLKGYEAELASKIDSTREGIFRVMISTPLPESQMAEYLATLQEKVETHGVKVGSYPRWGKPRNTVTLLGRDKVYIEGIVGEVVEALGGIRVETEGEDDTDSEETSTGGV